MFARRDEGRLQQRFEESVLELGSQLMLYGDTGAGKTSLVLHVANEMKIGVARVECFSGKSFNDLIGDAFAAIAEVQELTIRVSSGDSLDAETSGGVGLGWLASIKGRLKAGTTKGEIREFAVVQRPLIDALIETLVDAGKGILFFDNFENVTNDDVRRKIGELIGVVSDRAVDTGNLKIVVAGIADTAGDLMTMSTAASRRTIEFEVPRMPPDELASVIDRGMTTLGYEIGDEQRRRIVALSDGFPYVTHLLSLHAARGANKLGLTEITADVTDAAIKSAVQEFQMEMSRSYELASERSGAVQPRKHILQTLAHQTERDLTFPEITAAYRLRYGINPEKDLSILNVALGELILESKGAVLRRRGSPRSYRYGFRNPLMRPYLLLFEASGALQPQLGLPTG
jgi:hypothetical protein